MDKHQLADKLNNRQRTEEMTREEEKQAEQDALVVIYGYSDDGIEFRGAWNDSLGAFNNHTFMVNSNGPLKNKCDDDDCPYFQKELKEAVWWVKVEHDKNGYPWFITSNIPSATFEIRDDEYAFCRGIVIDTKEIHLMTP